MNVLTVDRCVDGERQPKLGHPAGDIELLLGGAGIGADPLRVLGIDVLEGDLDVIEPAFGQLFFILSGFAGIVTGARVRRGRVGGGLHPTFVLRQASGGLRLILSCGEIGLDQ